MFDGVDGLHVYLSKITYIYIFAQKIKIKMNHVEHLHAVKSKNIKRVTRFNMDDLHREGRSGSGVHMLPIEQ